MFWGQTSTPYYGYVRLAITAEGVENYFSPSAVVELFPVSFLGFRFGKVWNQSHLDYEDYDCTTYQCRGQFEETFLEAPLFLKYNRFLFSGIYRLGTWEFVSPTINKNYIDPSSGLPLSDSKKENMTQWRGYVFWEVLDFFRLGGFYSTWSIPNDNTVTTSDRQSRMWLGLIQYHNEKWYGDSEISFAIGAGEYSSEIKNTEPCVALTFRYAPIKKLGY